MDPTAPTPERPWQEPFLAALQETCNVSAAAKVAGIDRWTAYDRRRKDADFRAAWDDALEAATDALEAEARRRALNGTEEPVYYQGEECGRVRRYSDTLTIFLLKAHRPERFRDRVQAEHTGGVTVRVVYDEPGNPDPPAEAP